jgi:acyl dehydratase
MAQTVGSPAMDRYEVEAFNTATASTNKIHDDDVAKGLGFRGGLVPGVDVFAYLTHAPAARWGRKWLDGGWIDARFASPVYDGDTVTVESEADGDDRLTLRVVDSEGNECATGAAGPGAPDDVPTDIPTDIPERPEPQPPLPKASPEAFAAFPEGVLGSLEYGFHADRHHEYLADVRDTLPLYADEGVAHPGWLLRMANYALSRNVQLGPWIHVGSEVRLHRAVEDGADVSVRSRVAAVTERKGHRMVELDVVYVVDDVIAATVHHTAIYEPRARR